MDIFLLLVGFLLVLLGIVGAILPVLPGPLTGWFGLLALHITSVIPTELDFFRHYVSRSPYHLDSRLYHSRHGH